MALCGTGEAAELAYLTLKEAGLDPITVFADTGESMFLDLPVRPIRELLDVEVDRVIAVMLSAGDHPLEQVTRLGLPRTMVSSEVLIDRVSTAHGVWRGQAWFALRTAPRHEKKVHERLTSQGGESFLPLCERLSRWKDRRMRITAPLSPATRSPGLARRNPRA